MASNYVINILLSIAKKGTGGKDLTTELKGVDTATKKLQAGWKSFAAAGAAVAGAAYTLKKAFDFGKEGAEISQTRSSFEGLINTLGAAPDTLDRLRAAARGTVDDMTLMSSTSTLLAGTQGDLAQQLAGSTPRLLEIAKAANKLNPTLGDTTFLYQSLALGIKRASPMILDNLGLTIKIGEANEAFARKLGKTADALTAEEQKMALLEETLRAGGVLMEQAGGSAESMGDSFAQAEAQLKNITDQLKVALAPAISSAVGVLNTLISAMDTSDVIRFAGQVAQTADSYEEYAVAVIDAAVADRQLSEKEGEIMKAHYAHGASLEELQATYGRGVRISDEFANSIGLLTEQQLYAQRITGGVQDATEEWVEREQEADAWAGHLTASTLGLADAMAKGTFAVNESGEALDLAAESAKEAEAANEALAASVENVRDAYEGFYGTLASGLVSMRELGEEQRQSAADYESALAELEAKQRAVTQQVKTNWEASLPDPTTAKDRLNMAADAWDEWGLRLNDIMENGVASPWFETLQSMGMQKPPDTGVKEWAEELKAQFYEGELPELINTQSQAWVENTATMKAAQAEATASYQQEVGARKAALQEEIDALKSAREEQLAAEQEARNRATTELALSLAEQSGMLEQWSQQRFGPDFAQIADSASEVLALLDSGMLNIDSTLQGIVSNMTAGIQSALDTTGTQAEETKAILDGIASTDWAAEKQAQLSQALDMQNLIDPEGAVMAMEQIGAAITTALPEDPFAGLMQSFTGTTEAIVAGAGEMDSSLSLAFAGIGEESSGVAAAILNEWTGNSVFPDLIAGGEDAQAGITKNFDGIGSTSQQMAAIAIAAFNSMGAEAQGLSGDLGKVKSGMQQSAQATERFTSRVEALIAKLKVLKALMENMPTTPGSPPPAATGLDLTSAAARDLAATVSNNLGSALRDASTDANEFVGAASRLSAVGGGATVPPVRVGGWSPVVRQQAAAPASSQTVSVGGDTHNWYIQDQGSMALAMRLVETKRRERLNEFMGG